MVPIGSYKDLEDNFRSYKKNSLESKVRKMFKFTLKDKSEVVKGASHQKISRDTTYLPETMGTQEDMVL